MIWSEKKRWAFLGIPLTFTTYSLTEDKIIVDFGLIIARQEEIKKQQVVCSNGNRLNTTNLISGKDRRKEIIKLYGREIVS